MIHEPRFDEHRRRYAVIDPQGVRITCRLRSGAQLAHYDPPMFDNILARAVVLESTGGEGLAPSPEPYDIPLPLAPLWRRDDGATLWAASCLMPDGVTARDTAYLHKRAQTGEFTKGRRGRFIVSGSVGRWMERRVQTPTTVARSWSALTIGDAAEIERLLGHITHVGKRRAAGFGEVERWEVEALMHCGVPDVLIRDGALSRPLPLAALALIEPHVPVSSAAFVGWAVPQWLPALWSDGWSAGTPVTHADAEVAI